MNKFGKISQLEITAAVSQSGKTFIQDSFFTSPLKIMKPFANDDGSVTIYQQSSSAGLLAGDEQEHSFIVKKGTKVEIVSQSYEKIFKMAEGEQAKRKIIAQVEENAALIYAPLPCIPFSESSFSSRTEIFLKNETSRLVYQDILCAGRVAHGEAFDYHSYHNLIHIYRKEKLIFRDNAYFEGSDGGKNPEKEEFLRSPSVFGSFTHSGMLLLFGFGKTLSEIRGILGLEEKLLYMEQKNAGKTRLLIEANETDSSDIVVRALALSAEAIENEFKKIKSVV
ncbi:MAG: urease accessory protein UreD [Treponema sp.]|nr:urease accessory protein UreD [Treponema sp.]